MKSLTLLLSGIFLLVASNCSGAAVVDATKFNTTDWEKRIKDPALNETEFTRLYALRVAAEFKGAKVTIAGPRELSVKLPDGTEIKSFLDNAWAEVKADAGSRPETINRYLKSFKETQSNLFKENTPPDTNRIVPVIRDVRYAAHFAEIGQTGTNQVISQPFVADLLVMYVEEQGGNLRFITEGDRLTLNLSLPDLRKLALTNLKRLVPEVSRHGSAPVFFLGAGGNYESSLLLVEKIWDGETKSIKGDLVAAVPSRDWLVFTGSESPDGIQKVQKLIAQIEKDGDHLISSTLLVRRNGRWEKFVD